MAKILLNSPVHVIPTIRPAFLLLHIPGALSSGIAWVAVFSDFFLGLLEAMAKGHCIIGLCRLCGFRADPLVRNPLGARSVSDFFARYNYYYKELLLHAFYYPVFFRLSRLSLEVRVTAATLASVGVGNFLLHLARCRFLVLEMGAPAAALAQLPYLLYCIFLGALISIDQVQELRGRKTRRPPLVVIPGLILIFGLLRIFDSVFSGDIRNNLTLLFRLFGLA